MTAEPRCRHGMLDDGTCADCHPSLDPALHPASRFDADHRSGVEEDEE